jgi:four helix bundle protein
MQSTPEQLRERTKALAVRIVRLFRSLPNTREAQVIGNQLLRSGTSIGANYRAVCRARSRAEFIAKLGIVVEEADESMFWLELLAETAVVPAARLQDLLAETRELTAIFTAAQHTSRGTMKITNYKLPITNSRDPRFARDATAC